MQFSQYSTSNKHTQPWVYRLVFKTRLSVLAVLLLFISFLVQPFHQAQAAEAEAEADNQEVVDGIVDDVRPQTNDEDTKEVLPDVPNEQAEPDDQETKVIDDDQNADQDPDVDMDTSTATPQAPAVTTGVTATTTQSETIGTTSDDGLSTSSTATITEPTTGVVVGTTTESELANASTTGATTTNSDQVEDESEQESIATTSVGSQFDSTTATSTASTTVASDNSLQDAETQSVDQPVSGPVLTTGSEPSNDQEADAITDTPVSDEQISTESNESSTTSSTSALERVLQSSALVTNDNYYQFNRQSCVAVGDGTFHCSSNTDATNDSNSVVSTAIGENGSSEIFLRTKRGENKQITNNPYEDTAPFYDPETRQIVWQRAIDGRQQIILYDIEEGIETQLTFSRTNNMEPKVSKAGIVWQAWDGNDWEIMYFDGTYTNQITDNVSQDVTPVVEGEYIVWSVLGGEEQEARVYSLADEEILTINGHEGGAITNPRFILVYDTLFDNGDVVTRGFDPVTGLSQPIAAKSAPEPVEIPTPDPIGEISALVQNKSTDDDELTVDGSSTSSTSTAPTTTNAAGDLDLSSGEPVEAPATTTESAPLELTEYDIVITPLDTAASDVAATSTQP